MKRWFRRLVLTALLLLILAAGGSWLLLRGSLARLDGQAAGAGLSAQVTVTRDANGVPDISGQSRADIAFATGWVHGQERFFQMDLMRRVAAGELAELFGAPALPVDRAHRLHRFRVRAEAALLNQTAEDAELLRRYADGVNAGLQALRVRPPEYLLLNRSPRPWTSADSLLVTWAMYFDLQGNLESREWAQAWMREHLSAEQFAFLAPDSTAWDAPLDGPSPAPELTIPAEAPDWWRRSSDTKASSLDGDRLVGSNNWAISGSRAGAAGKAMLANDMHLGLRLPPVWYRAQLDLPGGKRLVGVTLPGAPLMIAGSNGHVAWGFTNAAGAWLHLIRLDQDAAHPGQVKIGEDWVSPSVTEETIAVKGAPDDKLLVRETALGPLKESDGQVYAVHWLADLPGAADLSLGRLETVESAEAALAIGAAAGVPQLNMLAADDQGHIGWTIAGPMESSHPRILDPADGQLQTANSRQLMGEGAEAIGDGGFDLGARARQIRDDLLSLGNSVDETALFGVQLDDRALFMQGWRDRALTVLDDEAVSFHPDRAEFRRLLAQSWDGHASVGSVGYRLARGWMYALYDLTFASLNDALSERDPAASYRLVSHRWPVVLAKLLDIRPIPWLPAGSKDWREVELAAVDRVIEQLTRNGAKLSDASWGKRNTAAIGHPFVKFLPWLKGFLAAPPDPLPGDSDMPRVAAPDFGQSERLVVAPGREETGLLTMPGGQSGHPLSPFFLAGHEDWVQGKPAPLLPGKPKYGLVLTPN